MRIHTHTHTNVIVCFILSEQDNSWADYQNVIKKKKLYYTVSSLDPSLAPLRPSLCRSHTAV